MLGDMLQQKREKMIWVCCVCFHDLHSEPSIICDSCLIWSHYKCVGISRLKIGFVDHAMLLLQLKSN